MVVWNLEKNSYEHVDIDHIKWSLKQVEDILIRWGRHPALIGFEPVNEPWRNTPLYMLKAHYRDVRNLMKKHAPDAYFVFHDSFRTKWEDWTDLFGRHDRHKVAIDHHHYTAWGSYNNVWMNCLDIT